MKKLTFLMTLALVAATAGVLLAEDPLMVAEGTVISTSPETLIIDAEGGRQVFVLQANSIHPQPIPPQSVVEVTYRDDGFGNLYATEIVVLSELEPTVEVTSEVGEPVAEPSPPEAEEPGPTGAESTEPIEVSQIESTEPVVAQESESEASESSLEEALPATAGPVPLLLLLGAGSLGAGFWLRRKAS